MLLSIVIPVFNEEETLPILLDTLCPIASGVDPDYELILVNDGSRDRTMAMIAEAAVANPHLKAISFSRNFGHQAAVTAGLDFASGDVVIVMDADLQDPPALLPELIAKYREGYDVVSPQRSSRESDTVFKRFTAKAFYWLMRNMVDARVLPEVGDFRLFSRPALDAIRGFREQHRFMRGLVAWLGLREAVVPFVRQSRVAGTTKYPFTAMLRFSWTAITSFSGVPLKFSLIAGMVIVAADFLYILWAVYAALVLRATFPGWTSLVVLQGVISGATLIAVGLLGDYVSRIYDEAKRRPLYIVDGTANLDPDRFHIERAVILRRGHP